MIFHSTIFSTTTIVLYNTIVYDIVLGIVVPRGVVYYYLPSPANRAPSIDGLLSTNSILKIYKIN